MKKWNEQNTRVYGFGGCSNEYWEMIYSQKERPSK